MVALCEKVGPHFDDAFRSKAVWCSEDAWHVELLEPVLGPVVDIIEHMWPEWLEAEHACGRFGSLESALAVVVGTGEYPASSM